MWVTVTNNKLIVSNSHCFFFNFKLLLLLFFDSHWQSYFIYKHWLTVIKKIMHQLFRVNPHRDYGDSEIQSPCIAICCVLHLWSFYVIPFEKRQTCRCGIQTHHCWVSGFKYIAGVFLIFFDTPRQQKNWHHPWRRAVLLVGNT